MNILFHLGHPAHFHLFKNTIRKLIDDGNNIFILIKKKDILEELLIESNFSYYNILPEGRKSNKLGIAIGQIKQNFALYNFVKSHKVDLMLGTSVSIAHIGKLLNIPSLVFNEDDADIVPFFSYLTYPFTDIILSPISCDNKRWNKKTIRYNSYHELAYLHPNNFSPSLNIVKKYIKNDEPYFIIRFSGLNAHHDSGISGLDNIIAKDIINILKPYGRIIINSEKELNSEFEQYRLNVNPLEMHHLLAFAKVFIGDSQTMAAEAGVLGTPFIRFNDFVGKIGYLNELENKYKLGFGFKTDDGNLLKSKIMELLKNEELSSEWQTKRETMLKDKIDFSELMVWFVVHFPGSTTILKKNPDYQLRFKYLVK